MTYKYAFPHPAVATDIVIYTIRQGGLHVLLIERGLEPFKGHMALPGGFVGPEEDIEYAARRELLEETGIDASTSGTHLEQVGAFGDPARDIRQQNGYDAYRVISVAYMALIPSQTLKLKADTDASDVKWVRLEDAGQLAFDHDKILERANVRLRARLSDKAADMTREKGKGLPVALSFLDETFTISELKTVYDLFSETGKEMDSSNFRKMVKANLELVEVGTAPAKGRHRPEKLYSIKAERL